RVVSTSRQRVGGADAGAGVRCQMDKLPRATEVEAPLEGPGRAGQISPTHEGEAEIMQRKGQREGMIGLLSDFHGGLGMPDGLIEPAELGERAGEAVSRGRQLDGRPEALVATVARERHVSLKQVDRLPEFAPGGVRYAQVGGGDPLDQAIAERAS